MARNLGLDDVVDHFTLVGDELDLLRNKPGATRLGFSALLKFILWRGRFPQTLQEFARRRGRAPRSPGPRPGRRARVV